jgi:cytochrome c-type biogenesis protein CcmH/NrfF
MKRPRRRRRLPALPALTAPPRVLPALPVLPAPPRVLPALLLAASLAALLTLGAPAGASPAAAAQDAVAQSAYGAAATADPELEAATRAVAAQLRCPVCQGESIQDSPADLAREMKAVVRDQLAAGRTPDEVKAYFVERYGEWILLAPPARGFNLLLYILPFAGLVVGGGVLFVLARRWQRETGGRKDAVLVHVREEEY